MTDSVRISILGGSIVHLLPEGAVRVGRADDCDLVVADPHVSRQHVWIGWHQGVAWLADTSSTGLFGLDGNRIDAGPILGPTRIRLGTPDGPLLELEPLAPAPTAPPPPPAPAAALSPTVDGTAVGNSTPLAADGVAVVTDGGSVLIRDVSLTFPAGTFTAILGPTGAGKSTLLKTLGGLLEPSAGTVRVDGRDLYAEYATLRSRVGLVPQEDIVHTRLTARQALTYGAELRLPDATSTADRDALVESTARALGLGEHLDKRIANLSGGQRKRVSVALELLSQPSIMLLDEPTSGLDPGYEDSLMDLFRQLAEEGRTVVVVTHSTASLDRCDQVVYLGTGGWVAYCGPSELALEATGAVDQPALFRWLESGVAQHPELALPPPPDGPQPHDARVATAVELSYPNSATTQFMTLVRRNAALLLTDPRALVVAAASALIPALLLALIVGASTFSTDDPKPGQARTLLTGMIVAAGVIGAANGLREIVKDRPIYQRERVAGLRRTTYLIAKLVVLGVLTVLQAEVVVLVASILSRPGRGNIAPAHVEMLVAAATTAVACLILGLFISAMVDTSEKALAMIPVLFVTLWLFSGTVSDLSGKPLLSQLAYLAPSSWGVAAAASTVDLPEISGCATPANPGATPPTVGPAIVCDARWGHSLPQWSFDLIVLGLLCAVGFLLTDWALARSEHLAPLRRQHLIGSSTRWVQAQFRSLSSQSRGA